MDGPEVLTVRGLRPPVRAEAADSALTPPPELFFYDGPLLVAWQPVFGSVAVYVTSGGLRLYWGKSSLPTEQRPALERDVARVRSFLGPEGFGQRGVAVELFDTSRVTVAEERDGWADGDPAYDATNVTLDAAWATFLGRDLAGWLGVAHEDEIP